MLPFDSGVTHYVVYHGECIQNRHPRRDSGCMMALRIAITGAGGFVGSHLQRQFRSLGHTVVPLCRKDASNAGEWIPFSLGEEVAPESLRGFDVLVHCAYDFRTSNVEEDRRRNVDGSILLLNAAY